jgi:thiol-disulfide isomerase/thioredoxin/uncharacterized membrane protein YphA (DoxX/SURF4 family)
MSILLLVARLLLAMVFIISGLAKIVDLRGSQKAVLDFGVPSFLAVPLGILLPLAELAVVVALISSAWALYGAIGALVLLLLFITAISVNLSFGRQPDCHCFGQLSSEPIGAFTLVRNAILAVIAGFIIWQGAAYNNVGLSSVAWIATLTTIDGIVLVTGVILFAIVALESWLLLQALTQQGRLLTRIELLEENGASVNNNNNPALGLPEFSDAPDFSLPDLEGNLVSLTGLLAEGADTRMPVILVFSSPTCGPCNAMLPEYSKWQHDYKDKAKLVMISQGTVEENRAKFANYDISPILLQENGEVAEAYKVRGTPSGVAIRFDGSTYGRLAEGEDAIFELLNEMTGEVVVAPINPLLEVNRPKGGLVFPEPPKIGEPAPDLTLLDLDSNLLKLSSFRGSPTLLLFWNPGCTFCQEMLRDLLIWEKRPPKGAPQLLVISIGGTKQDNHVGFKSIVVRDDSSSNFSVARWFKASATPSAILLDENGIVISELVEGVDEVMELTKPVRNRHRHKVVAASV